MCIVILPTQSFLMYRIYTLSLSNFCAFVARRRALFPEMVVIDRLLISPGGPGDRNTLYMRILLFFLDT